MADTGGLIEIICDLAIRQLRMCMKGGERMSSDGGDDSMSHADRLCSTIPGSKSPLIGPTNSNQLSEYAEKEGSVADEQLTGRNKGGHKRARIDLTVEEIKQQYGKTQSEAARCLGVSRSTLQRRCNEHRIECPGQKRVKRNDGEGDKLAMYEDHQVLDGNTSFLVYVNFKDEVIRFYLLSSAATLEAVQKEIRKSFENVGSCTLKYMDEKGLLISIKHDEHLRDYIKSSFLFYGPILELFMFPIPLTAEVNMQHAPPFPKESWRPIGFLGGEPGNEDKENEDDINQYLN